MSMADLVRVISATNPPRLTCQRSLAYLPLNGLVIDRRTWNATQAQEGGILNDEEVYRLRKRVKAFFRRLQREFPSVDGISRTAVTMLFVVDRSPEGVTPGKLAAELDMTDSNIAASLRTLETKDLVVRRNEPSDRRKALICLTERGREVTSKLRRDHYTWMRSIIESSLNEEEQKILLRAGELMQRLTEQGIETMRSEPPPLSNERRPVRNARRRVV